MRFSIPLPHIMLNISILWALFCLLFHTSHCQQNPQFFNPSSVYRRDTSPLASQWRMGDIIPANYNTQQPPASKNESVEVVVNLSILSFHRISELDQSVRADVFLHLIWTDKRLSLPQGFDPKKKLVLGSQTVSHLWMPALNFRNARSTQIFNSISPAVYATLNNKSEIFFAARLALDLSCAMDFSNYPFDTQRCKIEIGSLSYHMDVLKLKWGDFSLTKNLDLPQFRVKLGDVPQEKCKLSYTIGSLDCIRAHFKLVRNVGNFIITKYIPSFLIVCLTFTGFWIPTSAYPARVSLCITGLLALVTQQYQTTLNVSYIYALNVWMMANIFIVFAVTIEFAFAVSDWSERFVIVKGKYDLKHSSRSNSANLSEAKDDPKPSMSQKSLFFHRLLKSNAKNNAVDMFARIAFPAVYFVWIMIYIYMYTS